MQSDNVAAALAALVSVQGERGGWGWRQGAPENTECTGLAVLALNAWRGRDHSGVQPLQAGVAWLESMQRDDGSWPLSAQVPDASWMTSVATYALAVVRPGSTRARNGGRWLLGQRSQRPSLMQRARMAFSNEVPAVDQDPALAGWPWTQNTTAWVEPTSWALLALKQAGDTLPRRRVEDRLEQAHRLLADRMCRGGGWNYGNKAVLGFDLDPYPDTTALALIALQDAPSADLTEPAVARLRGMLAANRSSLVLALSVLALQLHGRDVTDERAALRDRMQQIAAATDVRVLALALLALDQQQLQMRVPANG